MVPKTGFFADDYKKFWAHVEFYDEFTMNVINLVRCSFDDLSVMTVIALLIF
jgi:hypothetical protein